MLVPKAAVHKDYLAQPWKGQVRSSRQVATMQTVAITQAVDEAADKQFGFGVSLADASHARADFGRRPEVVHN